MKVKNTYLLLVTIIGLFSLAIYSTYAMFTASIDVGEFVNLTASSLPTDTSMLEYERITLNSGDSKLVDLNITNSTTNSLYYGVWYEMINPSSKTDDITIAKLDTSTSETIGQLSSSTSSKVTLILENNTADTIVMNIGVGYSETSSLNLPINRNIISDVTSELIIVTTPVNFDYTGAVQEYTIPSDGKYKIELWGAQGGSYSSSVTGGNGGYTSGEITLSEGEKLYIYVGGTGGSSNLNSTYVSGGYNGGGSANYHAGTGGGATDVRLVNGAWNDDTSLRSRIMVAGGGGGAGAFNSNSSFNLLAGGVGGGLTGTDGTDLSTTWQGGGHAGTQISGGALGTGSSDSTNYLGTSGSFGQGGNGGYNTSFSQGSGAGGAGYYGGGGGSGRNGGGGGGSSYISGYTGSIAVTSESDSTPKLGCTTGTSDITCSYHYSDKKFVNATMASGSESMPTHDGTSVTTGNSGNGYARISQVLSHPSLTGFTDLRIGQGESIDLLSDVTCVDDGCTIVKTDIIDTSILAEGEYTVTYIVKDNNNKRYKFIRKLIVVTNLDESGANKPKLVDGLIPVMYNGSNWVKTSSSNNDSTYQWYDYNKKKWANAVLVTSTNRSTYQNASNGTVIPESDVLAYYVWIPRYKYKVWNITKTVGTDSYDAYHTGIDIVFENGIESSGTITCNYDFTVTDGSLSEICSGTNGEYYTHPAFTFGDKEVEGIWVGKFEISSSTPTAENGGGNSTSLTVRTKPSTNSWRYNQLINFSYVIQNMQASSNEYGLTTDKTAADSHMIKNMEWGAVAYLTNSNYGRCSDGTCTEVSINSYESYKTGCGPQSAGSVDSGTTCDEYTTALGQTASTTGNVYGIYDMSGGAWEYVMGNMSRGSGSYTYNAQNAGSNFTYSAETAKYLDTYAYGTSAYDQTAYNRARLGDATGEIMLRASGSGGWYNDYSNFTYSSGYWFIRGGTHSNVTNAGALAFYYDDGTVYNNDGARCVVVLPS